MTELLWNLLLVAVVAGAAYFAGWKAAEAYLNSSVAVSSITASVIKDTNEVTSALDKMTAEGVSMRASVDRNSEVINARLRAVEDSFAILFHGFQEAGLIRKSQRATPRQVGEDPAVQGEG